MGQPDDKPGFIEEALRHRQVAEPDEPAALEADEDDVAAEAAEANEPNEIADPQPVAPPALVPEPRIVATTPFADWPTDDRALVDEALKKSGLIWIRSTASPQGQPFWHVWLNDRIYLLTGGTEQPDGGLTSGDEVTVVVPSKDTHARLLTIGGTVSQLSPADPDWADATTALAGARLNLHDVPGAPERWANAAETTVLRVTPAAPAGERPGSYDDVSGRAEPRQTPATTSGPKPRVLHRRHGSGRPLS